MRHILITLLLLVAWSAAGQRTFTGRTITADGMAVEGVSISIENSGVGTTSDRRGVFSLRIPEGLKNDTISVTHVAYEEIKVPVATLGGDITFTLTPHSLEAEEVLVEGGRARRVTIDQRGNRAQLWSWTFSEELAEFGTYIDIEDNFLVHSFRVKTLSPVENLNVIFKAELMVYRVYDGYMAGVMRCPAWFGRIGSDMRFIYEKPLRPFEQALEEEEDGFIKIDDFTIKDYDHSIRPDKELILEKGRYLITLKYIITPENVLLLQFPWMLPRFVAYNGPGVRRYGNELEFDACDKNPGILLRGYGE